jgi:TolA-binding protein
MMLRYSVTFLLPLLLLVGCGGNDAGDEQPTTAPGGSAIEDAGDAAGDMLKGAGDAMKEAGEQAQQAFEQFRNQFTQQLDEQEQEIEELQQSAQDTADEQLDSLLDQLDSKLQAARDKLQELASDDDGPTEAIQRELEQLGDEIADLYDQAKARFDELQNDGQ